MKPRPLALLLALLLGFLFGAYLCWVAPPIPAGAQGVGIFGTSSTGTRTNCTQITNPVVGQSICFDQAANTWKVYTGAASASAQWVSLTATQSGVNNVRDFGATGNGTTDDTAALQAAITAGTGAITYIPAGTYMYSALTLPSNTTLTGPGTLKWLANQNVAADAYSITASGALSNISLVGLIIDGNKANQSGAFRGNGMLIRGVAGYRIEGTTWQNWHYDAIEITSAIQNNPLGPDTPPADPTDVSTRGRIVGNLFTDIGRNTNDGTGFGDAQTIQFGSTVTDLDVTGNVLINCINGIKSGAYNRRVAITGNVIANVASLTYANTAISVEQLTVDSVVSGNSIVGPYQEGILIESAQRASVIGNTIYNTIRGINAFASSVAGVSVNMRNITIAGNTVTAATSGAANSQSVRVVQSTAGLVFDTSVTGNTIAGAGNTYGIQYNAVNGGVVAGNTVRGTLTGIACESTCTDVNIVGNRISGVTAEGIFLGAAANTRLGITGNVSTGNALGLDISANQASVTVTNNVFLNNSTADIRNSAANGTAVAIGPNQYGTSSGSVQPTVTPSLSIGTNAPPTGILRVGGEVSVASGVSLNATQTLWNGGTAAGVPRCTNNCGTSPSVAGTNSAMRVTLGATGTPATPFLVLFNGTWNAAPACVAQIDTPGTTAATVTRANASATGVSINAVVNPPNSAVYSILCLGVG